MDQNEEDKEKGNIYDQSSSSTETFEDILDFSDDEEIYVGSSVEGPLGSFELLEKALPLKTMESPRNHSEVTTVEDLVKLPLFDKIMRLMKEDEPCKSKCHNVTSRQNITLLHNKITRFKSQSAKSKIFHQGLEAKIHALLHDDCDQDFKNDAIDKGKNKEISFLDFSQEFSDCDYETLESLKSRAIQAGKEYFHLTKIILLMSKTDKTMEKLKIVAELLKWVREGTNSVIIDKFLELVETADTIMSKNKKKMAGISGSDIKDQELAEDGTDKLILELMKGILDLEQFWFRMHGRVPGSTSILVAEMGMYERKVTLLSVLLAVGYADYDDRAIRESDEHNAMVFTINELCKQIEESEKMD